MIIGDAMDMNRGIFDGHDPKSLLIFGNLPFAVATPLTLKLIKLFSERDFLPFEENLFAGVKRAQMVLMFQLEVAKKFTAKVGTTNYGRLAVMARSFCDRVELVERVPASKFTPKPKVDAGVVRFDFNFEAPCGKCFSTRRFSLTFAGTYNDLETLTNNIFRHRNKKLALDPQLGINPNWRPHHLAPDDLYRILQHQLEKEKPSS